eukprot:gene14705-biopygen4509
MGLMKQVTARNQRTEEMFLRAIVNGRSGNARGIPTEWVTRLPHQRLLPHLRRVARRFIRSPEERLGSDPVLVPLSISLSLSLGSDLVLVLLSISLSLSLGSDLVLVLLSLSLSLSLGSDPVLVLLSISLSLSLGSDLVLVLLSLGSGRLRRCRGRG